MNDPSVLALFHPPARRWFEQQFTAPTPAQQLAWPAIARGENVLLLAPTGSGKTLAAFFTAIDRLLFAPPPEEPGARVLYISPLKALAADVERNLRQPLAGVALEARRMNLPARAPRAAIRSGDTTPSERTALRRAPPEILITTPESLYLLLTSRARDLLRSVETVIVDEIHTLVSTKRGAHLFLSLERLERLRRAGGAHRPPLQRLGLSATQRPLEEVARLLGGAEATAEEEEPPRRRPVTILDAGRRKPLELRVELPWSEPPPRSPAPRETPQPPNSAEKKPAPGKRPSAWDGIVPRLVELIAEHRSTMIFVNSRRLAERLAAAVNERAGRELALAHHGSVARDTRREIEERLKVGELPAIVATSSLELGIDMSGVDLVIQIEAPPTIAAGLQRIGRAGHRVGEASRGVLIPKYRGDLLATAAAVERMLAGEVEATYYPRNPLDILAQQLVAMASLEPIAVDEAYALVRGAAPFAELSRGLFEHTLDLLAGRYPSAAFAELRPRLNWDRVAGRLAPRRGTQRLAVANAGTIPDRGLYGVFLPPGEEGGGRRVGELDEEMVFETKPGEVFLLGASSWRVLEITHDRVLAAPAPGEPGRMPFWRGEGPGRPLEFGRAIGRLARELAQAAPQEAERRLRERHALEPAAAAHLVAYLHEQALATGEPPSDRAIVCEAFADELGDRRLAILSPFGSRVHAPWGLALQLLLGEEARGELDLVWSDDGLLLRLPGREGPPPWEKLLPRSEEVESLVVQALGGSALFAARFRENAARALLLPRRFPGRRTPLWLQRRKAADLLAVAAQFPDFPLLLETYRECLRDLFDLPGLRALLAEVERGAVRVVRCETERPSPFASSLLFNYVGAFLYQGDAPLAERRARALALDHAQLQELLGDSSLRELLDPAVIAAAARELQRLGSPHPPRDADALHGLLLQLGDLTPAELAERSRLPGEELNRLLEELRAARRIIRHQLPGESRYAAAEDASRYRDALDWPAPAELPPALREPAADPLGDLLLRFARTHPPFTTGEAAARWGLPHARVEAELARLVEAGRLARGEFLPGGKQPEWCDRQVLRLLKHRSLAALRRAVEPLPAAALARFLPFWHGVVNPARGEEGLLAAIEQLQGYAAPWSVWEAELLPARVADYTPAALDALCLAGEVVWRGSEPLGERDGRVAFYLAEDFAALAPRAPAEPVPSPVEEDPRAAQLTELLSRRGALFFEELVREIGGFPPEILAILWRLVWRGEVTGDSPAPLRSLAAGERKRSRRREAAPRRPARLPGSEGRWWLLANRFPLAEVSATEHQAALAQQLLRRHGVVTAATVRGEGVPGGFSGLYPVFRALEEGGRVRRGYFLEQLGAAQFAAPGAAERLRNPRAHGEQPPACLLLAAVDPANPLGSTLPWPPSAAGAPRPQRTAGARVVVVGGEPLAWLARGGALTFLAPPGEAAERLAVSLAGRAEPGGPIYLPQLDGLPVGESPWREPFLAAGFSPSRGGLLHRGVRAE